MQYTHHSRLSSTWRHSWSLSSLIFASLVFVTKTMVRTSTIERDPSLWTRKIPGATQPNRCNAEIRWVLVFRLTFFCKERNLRLEEVTSLVGNLATNYPNVQEFINSHFSKYFHRNPTLFDAGITEVWKRSLADFRAHFNSDRLVLWAIRKCV